MPGLELGDPSMFDEHSSSEPRGPSQARVSVSCLCGTPALFGAPVSGCLCNGDFQDSHLFISVYASGSVSAFGLQ